MILNLTRFNIPLRVLKAPAFAGAFLFLSLFLKWLLYIYFFHHLWIPFTWGAERILKLGCSKIYAQRTLGSLSNTYGIIYNSIKPNIINGDSLNTLRKLLSIQNQSDINDLSVNNKFGVLHVRILISFLVYHI